MKTTRRLYYKSFQPK